MSDRQVISFIVGVLAFIGVVSIGVTAYSVHQIENELVVAGDFHTEALFELNAINLNVAGAVQESLAFALSGLDTQAREFLAFEQAVSDQLAVFFVKAKLDSAGKETERAFFKQITAAYSDFSRIAHVMIRQYAAGRQVLPATFAQHEETVDRLEAAFKQLVQFEEGKVESAHMQAMEVVSSARTLMWIQGLVILAVVVLSVVLATRFLARVFTLRVDAERDFRIVTKALDSVTVGMLYAEAADPEMPLLYSNPGFEVITGYPAAEIIGRNCRFLQGPGTNPDDVARIRDALKREEAVHVVILNYRKNGEEFWNDLTISPVRDEAGEVTHFIGIVIDLTERIQLENQLLQAQKMDAVGQLAGGIAHDFNNYLTIINGAAELLSQGVSEDVGFWSRQILEAGERSSALTKQLLAFARKQVLNPQEVNLNDVVESIVPFLRRTIGADVELQIRTEDKLGTVKVDRSQFDQVITNLVINARDAMPDGGIIHVETGNILITPEYASVHPGMSAGQHVILTVTDNGAGMAPALLEKIFEPFVTTKSPDKGTGLGLATVYGIVKQSGGFIDVQSEVGRGTTFRLYFQSLDAQASKMAEPAAKSEFEGEGLVLLTEDDDVVRAVAKDMLTGIGFQVIEAKEGTAGLQMLEQHPQVRLLLTDVTMPGMSGFELAEKAQAICPHLRIVYMSGYNQDRFVPPGTVVPGYVLLKKPFSSGELKRKLNEALSGARGTGAPPGKSTA